MLDNRYHCLCSLTLYPSLKQTYRCVKKQAATSKNPGDSKSLWIFTNEDSPCRENEDEKKQVVTVAKDTVENGLKINVWPLPRRNASFDRSKF